MVLLTPDLDFVAHIHFEDDVVAGGRGRRRRILLELLPLPDHFPELPLPLLLLLLLLLLHLLLELLLLFKLRLLRLESMLLRLLLLLSDPSVADDDLAGDAAVGDSPVGADAADASGVHVPVVPSLQVLRRRKASVGLRVGDGGQRHHNDNRQPHHLR